MWDERARGAPAPSATKGNLRAVRAIARVSASSRPALPHCPLPTPRVALHRRRCRIGRFDAAGRRCAVVAQRPTLCQRRSSRCARSCGPVVRPPADTLHQVAAEGTSNQFTSFAEQSARRPGRSDAGLRAQTDGPRARPPRHTLYSQRVADPFARVASEDRWESGART